MVNETHVEKGVISEDWAKKGRAIWGLKEA
jgi:hypothetical protein